MTTNAQQTFADFPKWLHHPSEQPAIISDDYENGVHPRIGYQAAPGRARSLPPVLVNNPDQQAYYESRGYIAGPSGKEAAIRAPLPPNYQYKEYPRVDGNGVIPDPAAPAPPDNRYPMWVETPGGDVLVQNAEQEAAVREKFPLPDEEPKPVYTANCGEAAEDECGLKDPRKCEVHGPTWTEPDPLLTPSLRPRRASGFAQRQALVREAKALGLKIHRSWSNQVLLREIAAAKGEAYAEAETE